MSDLYDKIKNDVPFRKEVAEKAGVRNYVALLLMKHHNSENFSLRVGP